jgi:hypothetical protein
VIDSLLMWASHMQRHVRLVINGYEDAAFEAITLARNGVKRKSQHFTMT